MGEMMLDVAAAYEAHGAYLLRMAVRLVGRDMAEDLVQDAWVRVIGAAESYAEDGLRSWLCTIVHNLAVNSYRCTPVYAFTRDHPEAVSLETVVLGRLALVELQPAIAKLTPAQRTALHRARQRLKELVA